MTDPNIRHILVAAELTAVLGFLNPKTGFLIFGCGLFAAFMGWLPV